MKNTSQTMPLVLISHSRPVSPTNMPWTSISHVASVNPPSANNAATMARGMPTRVTNHSHHSLKTESAPDQENPMAMNVSATTYAASVLHIAIFSFAAISAVVVIGLVAVNGVTP